MVILTGKNLSKITQESNIYMFQSKINNRMANSVNPDEMAHYEPSHLDQHCLQKCLCWLVGMKGLTDLLMCFNCKTVLYICL